MRHLACCDAASSCARCLFLKLFLGRGVEWLPSIMSGKPTQKVQSFMWKINLTLVKDRDIVGSIGKYFRVSIIMLNAIKHPLKRGEYKFNINRQKNLFSCTILRYSTTNIYKFLKWTYWLLLINFGRVWLIKPSRIDIPTTPKMREHNFNEPLHPELLSLFFL